METKENNAETPLKPVELILEPDEVTALASVLDTALRSGGMGVIDQVYILRKKMQEALKKQV